MNLTQDQLKTINNPKLRHDVMVLFEVCHSNPNGDPDADNAPRTDSCGFGVVTDVSLKRKIRDVCFERFSQDLFMQRGSALDAQVAKATGQEGKKKKSEDPQETYRQVCKAYWDVRMFGAVLASDVIPIQGPFQWGFGKSLAPIVEETLCITRCAGSKEGGAMQTMGRKATVEWAVYQQRGTFSPNLGEKTGVSEEDLYFFWQSLYNAFEDTRSAARPDIRMRKIIIFTHPDKWGVCHAHTLFDKVALDVEGMEESRSFIEPVISGVPEGITVTEIG